MSIFYNHREQNMRIHYLEKFCSRSYLFTKQFFPKICLSGSLNSKGAALTKGFLVVMFNILCANKPIFTRQKNSILNFSIKKNNIGGFQSFFKIKKSIFLFLNYVIAFNKTDVVFTPNDSKFYFGISNLSDFPLIHNFLYAYSSDMDILANVGFNVFLLFSHDLTDFEKFIFVSHFLYCEYLLED